MLGVPHGLNVLTNLPFLGIGLWGLARLLRGGRPFGADGNRAALWLSVALLTFGSGAYHVLLTPATLALDRIGICAILAFVLVETLAISWPNARRPAVALGLLAVTEGSVALWLLGFTSWPYGALQAIGGVAVLWIAVREKRSGRLSGIAARSLFLFVAFYAVAKAAELFDEPICRLTGVFGGHPLKHLLAAAGLVALLPWLGVPRTAP